MKKIFSILAVALVAFSFASCDKKNEPTPGKDVTFNITVSDIASAGATVAVEPSDTAVWYYWSVYKTASLVNFVNLDSAAVSIIDMEVNYYGETFESLVEGYMIVKGKDEYTFASLSPSTEYTVLAFAVNEKLEILSKVASKTFKTTDVVVKETIALDLADAEYSWQYDTQYQKGLLYATAKDAAKGLGLDLYVLTGATPAGNFTADDLYEPYAAYGYVMNCVWDEEESIVATFALADITGTLNADSTYTYGGSVTSAEGVKYTFSNVVATVMEEEPEADGAPARAQAKNVLKNYKKAVKVEPARK